MSTSMCCFFPVHCRQWSTKETNLTWGVELCSEGLEEHGANVVRECRILRRTQQICHFSIHQMPWLCRADIANPTRDINNMIRQKMWYAKTIHDLKDIEWHQILMKDSECWLTLVWFVPKLASIDKTLMCPNLTIICSCHSDWMPRVKEESFCTCELMSSKECSW